MKKFIINLFVFMCMIFVPFVSYGDTTSSGGYICKFIKIKDSVYIIEITKGNITYIVMYTNTGTIILDKKTK